MIVRCTLPLLLLCLLPADAWAIRVPGLYAVEIPVTERTEGVAEENLATAFRLVLIKLTGDRQAAARTSLQPLMDEARSYLQQYRYRETTLDGATEAGAGPAKEMRLWVKFDEENLNRALRALGVPVWGRERPSTLVWLAVADEAGRRLAGPENDPGYIKTMDQRARQRGIVLLHPLLDLDDSRVIRASDLWGGFREPIFNASSRYQADAILTGAIESPVPGIWEARWTAYIDDNAAAWTSESDIPEAVLDEGVDRLADILAAQFARTAGFTGVEQVRLSVSDVFDVDQYAGVLKYLQSLNSVSDVEVAHVENGRITCLLQVHGGDLAVSQAIELGRVLEPISADRRDYRLLP